MPRVTEIITEILLPPGYFDLANPTKGTYLHQAIAWWINGELDEASLDDKLKPQFQKFVEFWQDNEPEPILIEQTLAHPAGFEGTPDLVVKLKDEKAIIDIKTGGEEEWHYIQLAAYQELVHENHPDLGWPVCYNLYLTKTGYRLKMRRIYELFLGWKLFRAGLEIYKWRKQWKTK